MAQYSDIQKTIIEILIASGEKSSAQQISSRIARAVNGALSDMDFIVDWDVAVKDFTKTITTGNDSVSVGAITIFKPIICLATVSDSQYPLQFLHLTDLKGMTAVVEETGYPEYYSLGGNNIYVGPGLLTLDITVSGSFRRGLTISDIPYLPESLVTDRALMRLLKPGTPEHIAAWSGWKEGAKTVRENYRITGERRSNVTIDAQVQENMDYLDSL